jgi:hypothetical protein
MEEVSVEGSPSFFIVKGKPVEEELQTLPIKKGEITDIDGRKLSFEIVKVVPLPQTKYLSGIKEKIYTLEKLMFEGGEEGEDKGEMGLGSILPHRPHR